MLNSTITEDEINQLLESSITASEDFIKRQKLSDAEALLKQALKVNPKFEPALRLLTDLLLNQQKGEEAIQFYEKLLELKPTDQVALNNIALCYTANGQKEKALDIFERCSKLFPNEPTSHSNLALQYKNMGRDEEALKAYETGISVLPNNAEIRFNFGVFLAERSLFDKAIEQYKKAIFIKPDFYLAHFNLSLVNLLIGNFKEGWQEYEWRFGHQVFKKFKNRFTGPEWNGEDGTNKTILIYNEQGAGDAIQFARYLPELKKRGFKVILEVIYDLVDLLSQCKGVDQVIPQRMKNMPSYDYHVSIASLPLKLELYEPFFNGRYIQPTGSVEDKVFRDYEKFNKIGICWAGNPVHRHDHKRSCELKHFRQLNSIPNVKMFSLQKDCRPRFWNERGIVDLTEGCENMGVVNMGDLLINFNYTAAIMECMNHIVTVDTAVAHLAGAMNLPCYMLLPEMPDWRWGMEEYTTKWYNSIKLVRQKNNNYCDCLEQITNKISS